MRKIKILTYFLVLIILINLLTIPVYADDEIEEDNLTKEDITQMSAKVEKVPTINSRNAIVYDRTSRRSYIW